MNSVRELRHPIASLVLAVLVVIVAGVGVEAGLQNGLPFSRADLSLTPRGWVPVVDGDVLISIPATWQVFHGSPPCISDAPTSELLVNPLPGLFHCPPASLPASKTVVFLRPFQVHSTYAHRTLINGISVYRYLSGGPGAYVIPSLGVEIQSVGTFGPRVLRTLLRFPAVLRSHAGQKSVGTRVAVAVRAWSDNSR